MPTQIVTRQIADQAITAAKIIAGAAIESSKLADGANFVKKDGTVAMTGNLDLGSQKIVNLQTPSVAGDAASKGYVDTQITNVTTLFTSKGTVRVASVVNGLLASAFANASTVDGIALVTGDRILLKAQTTQGENGLYVVAASGAPTRATDMDTWGEVSGAWVTVQQGTANADTVWLSTADTGGTLGTTAITWVNPISTAGMQAANFVSKETPTGAINGVNTTFTLANTPLTGTEEINLNGLEQIVGGAEDYTISGATITMLTAPLTGEKIRVSYRK
jgi:hypothetical protein